MLRILNTGDWRDRQDIANLCDFELSEISNITSFLSLVSFYHNFIFVSRYRNSFIETDVHTLSLIKIKKNLSRSCPDCFDDIRFPVFDCFPFQLWEAGILSSDRFSSFRFLLKKFLISILLSKIGFAKASRCTQSCFSHI